MMRNLRTFSLRHRRNLVGAACVAVLALVGAMVVAGSEAAAPNPAAAQLGIFDHGAPPSGQVPGAVQQALENVPRNSAQGRSVPGKLRQLGANLGVGRASLYAYPTEEGSVCFVLTENGAPATCVDRFDRNTTAAGVIVYSGEGVPPTVAGIRGPDVQQVEAIVNGKEFDAVAGRRLIFFQLPSGTSRDDLDAVVVHFRDGTSGRYFDW